MKKPTPKPSSNKPASPNKAPVPASAQRTVGAAPTGARSGSRQQVDQLAFQIQTLATRLEALRSKGFGKLPEFRQLEQLLATAQEKLGQAEGRLPR